MLPYWITAIGICFIFKYGSILDMFRKVLIEIYPEFEKFFKCCLCMGFWAGLVVSIFSDISENKIFFAFQTSAICWFADLIITFIINVNYLLEKLDSSEESNLNK